MIKKKRFILLLFILCALTVVSYSYTLSETNDSIAKYISKGDYEKAKWFLNTQKKSLMYRSDSAQVEWYIQHGKLTSILLESDSAINSLAKALKISKELNSNYLMAKVKVQQLEFNRKLRNYDIARTLIKELRNSSIQDSVILCSFYHRAAAVFNEIHYGNSWPATLDTARRFSEQSLAIAEKLQLKSALATCYNELGDIYEKLKDWDACKRNYQNAIKLWDGTDAINKYIAMNNLAEFYANRGLYDSAIFSYRYVIDKLKNTKYFDLQCGTYGGLKAAYFLKGDSLNGFRYNVMEVYSLTRLAEERSRTKVNELTIAYETEKKENQLLENKVELGIKNKQLNSVVILAVLLAIAAIVLCYFIYSARSKNTLLQKLNDENQFLMGEANHRIKNNLQLIISLIGREIYNSKVANPVLDKLSDKINTIAALHQQLYLRDAKDSISVKNYVLNIYENFKGGLTLQDLSFEMEIDDVELKVDKAVYLGLLITELITNSLKHAFTVDQNKLIALSIQRSNNQLFVTYLDNGIGLSEKEKPKLVNLLLNQLEAKVLPYTHQGYSIYLKFEL